MPDADGVSPRNLWNVPAGQPGGTRRLSGASTLIYSTRGSGNRAGIIGAPLDVQRSAEVAWDDLEADAPRLRRRPLARSADGSGGANTLPFAAAVLAIDLRGYTSLTGCVVDTGPESIERFEPVSTAFFARLIEHIAAIALLKSPPSVEGIASSSSSIVRKSRPAGADPLVILFRAGLAVS